MVELNPAGSLVYAAVLGGSAGLAIALDAKGAVWVSGNSASAFPATSGAVAGGPGGFILKLDAALTSVLLSINGYGGLLAFDSAGNLYIAGTVSGGPPQGFQLPQLPAGAFQTGHATQFCSQSSGTAGFAILCSYQYVAKLDPTGGTVAWATYVTGTYGATPVGLAVDSGGNVIVAGTTNSTDYPVTSGALQTAYAPNSPAPPDFGPPATLAPAATGYLTKLNAAGTSLLWSTYFGGSDVDHIGGLSVSPSGDIYLSGLTGSGDLPGLSGVPSGCRPTPNQALGFVAQITSDAAETSAVQLIAGAPACLYSGCSSGYLTGFDFSGWPLALRPDGTAVLAGTSGSLASVDFSVTNRLACLTDVTDNTQLSGVAPGQLIALFGTNVGPATALVPPGGVIASSDSLGVFFNGIPAPVLYASEQQLNIQVPYEIAGQTTVQMQVTVTTVSPAVSESHTVSVLQRQPSVFLSADALLSDVTGSTPCGSTVQLLPAVLALNADGTLNDCANPAAGGSAVTIFLNGLGVVTPAQSTGGIASAPAQALTPSLDPNAGNQVSAVSTITSPGSISGVSQAQLQLPQNVGSTVVLWPSLAGTPVRLRQLFIWTRPN